jgi:hypothetical protein
MIKNFKDFEQFLKESYEMEEITQRKVINLLDYAPEIMNFFRLNGYQKTKNSLKSAISDWLDDEFYTLTDKQQIYDFLEKFGNSLQ